MAEFLFSHPVALAALVLGYILLVVEFCIPGFGFPGVAGVVLAILGVLAMQPTPLQALLLVAAYLALLCIALAICLRSAARGRLSKSRLVLNEVSTRPEAAESSDLDYFVGQIGAAHTPLRPSGIAEFNGVRLNVLSNGDYIERGAPVRVDRVEGKRIIVSQIQE